MSIIRSCLDKIIPFSEALTVANRVRKSHKIVFTNGVFDLMHKGHLTYLAQASELGNFLWVGLNSDSSVKKIKGPERPINSEEDRALLLACLSFVSAVTVFIEETPIELIARIRPDVHTKGGDYDREALPETPLVRSLGGEVQILPFVEGFSSTEIIRKIRGV